MKFATSLFSTIFLNVDCSGWKFMSVTLLGIQDKPAIVDCDRILRVHAYGRVEVSLVFRLLWVDWMSKRIQPSLVKSHSRGAPTLAFLEHGLLHSARGLTVPSNNRTCHEHLRNPLFQEAQKKKVAGALYLNIWNIRFSHINPYGVGKYFTHFSEFLCFESA